MSLRVCLDCTTAFAVGVRLCPHCGSERHAEQGSAEALGVRGSVPVESEEDTMPKITRHGGPSVAGEEPEADAAEGGEDVSAGSSTETSSEKPSKSDEPSSSGRQSPARKTESRSAKGRTGSSSARSTGGGQTGPSSGSAADD